MKSREGMTLDDDSSLVFVGNLDSFGWAVARCLCPFMFFPFVAFFFFLRMREFFHFFSFISSFVGDSSLMYCNALLLLYLLLLLKFLEVVIVE